MGARVRPEEHAAITGERICWTAFAAAEERISQSTLLAAKLSGPGVEALTTVVVSVDWRLGALVVPTRLAGGGTGWNLPAEPHVQEACSGSYMFTCPVKTQQVE